MIDRRGCIADRFAETLGCKTPYPAASSICRSCLGRIDQQVITAGL